MGISLEAITKPGTPDSLGEINEFENCQTKTIVASKCIHGSFKNIYICRIHSCLVTGIFLCVLVYGQIFCFDTFAEDTEKF